MRLTLKIIYVIVISWARGMYGIYCTEARGQMGGDEAYFEENLCNSKSLGNSYIYLGHDGCRAFIVSKPKGTCA